MMGVAKEKQGEVPEDNKFLMAMGPERSKPLHNFTLPRGLKWGNQRLLQCVKVSSHGQASALHRRSSIPEVDRRGSIVPRETSKAPLEFRGSGSKSKRARGGDQEIEAVRVKLMCDLQTVADRMKYAILRDGLEKPSAVVNDEAEGSPDTVAAATEAVKTWNLRSRRAAANGGGVSGSDDVGGAKSLKVDALRPNLSLARIEGTDGSKSPMLRGHSIASKHGEKRERAKFSVPLSRREIEEDFMKITRQKPSRRPKKRPKTVQKQLDTLFPGLWLTEINADFYRVDDSPETGKRKS